MIEGRDAILIQIEGELVRQNKVLREALERIVFLPPMLNLDNRQQEVLCYWPKDNPVTVARNALAKCNKI
jgi:hypothetical protein